MKQVFTFLLCLVLGGVFAQTTANFENLYPGAESYDNNADGAGFSSGNIILPNQFTDAGGYDNWSGWAISSTTDVTTAGYTNQYSAITGGGYDGSDTYATTYFGGIMNLAPQAIGGKVEGVYITNNTYASISMENGDNFSKKFGGELGDDPDFFLLTIEKYLDGSLGTEKVEFYLADYRFSDNSQDYIVKTWEYVDLLPLGNVDSLKFSLSSSDNNMLGMLTPAYFSIDNLTTMDVEVATTDLNEDLAFSLYPNISSASVMFNWPTQKVGRLFIFDVQGQLVKQSLAQPGENTVNVADLDAGTYFMQVMTEDGFYTERFVVF